MKNNDFFQKKRDLDERIKKFQSLGVAFSGGVDSTFLLMSAKKILGDNVLAILVKTPMLPEREEKEAISFLKKEKIRFSVITPDILSVDEFAMNDKERCYHCKKVLFSEIRNEAAKFDLKVIAHGVNTDDFQDYRPGLKAADELGFIKPLADSGFSKEDIRRASREMELETADKPAMACLASRIPYGTTITENKLLQVERAEDYLKDLGFAGCRVRYHGDVARVEIAVNDFHKIIDDDLRLKIVKQFHDIGFSYVSLDLSGYSQGSMNKTIQK